MQRVARATHCDQGASLAPAVAGSSGVGFLTVAAIPASKITRSSWRCTALSSPGCFLHSCVLTATSSDVQCSRLEVLAASFNHASGDWSKAVLRYATQCHAMSGVMRHNASLSQQESLPETYVVHHTQ